MVCTHNIAKEFYEMIIKHQVTAHLMWLYIILVSANGVIKEGHFDNVTSIPNPTLLREGFTLKLYCTHLTIDDIEIQSPSRLIVQTSNLVHTMTGKYDFEKLNSTTCVVTIKSVTRNDGGVYTCREGIDQKSALVDVIYSPSNESPLCASNYLSPVIFDDLLKDFIEFICTTEEGNPPVEKTLNIFKSDNSQNITEIADMCTSHDTHAKRSSFYCHLNKSLNNTTFVCDVTQQLPPPYNDRYEASCSFGPLRFLPSFSVSIFESDVRVKGGEHLNLTCTSNVTGVELKWINIPEGWNHRVTNREYSSHLEIDTVKQHLTSVVIVQCIGSYGNRNITDSVNITVDGDKGFQTGLILTVIFLVIFCISFLLGYYGWKKGTCASFTTELSLRHLRQEENKVSAIGMRETTVTSNTNNANNTAIEAGDDYDECNVDPSNDGMVGDKIDGMCDNPMYETAQCAAAAVTIAPDESVDPCSEISK